MKIVIYDRTALFDKVQNSNDLLTYTWMYGTRLFKTFNSLDMAKGVASWDEALDFLLEQSKTVEISGVQFWGHGARGLAAIGTEALNKKAATKRKAKLAELGSKMSPDAYWWWRTCGTYGGEKGQEFAKHFTDLLGRKTAGHTHIIGFWQSGGYTIRPGEEPHWSDVEGFGEDGMVWSNWDKPNTIVAMQIKLPKSWSAPEA